ncbi:hypothetical protein SanaruYs_09990 [Chryseotalea sanaruensis]|uniref:Uncharacterized protein n=1 Tax=Chryseotalea sanaruensis TaxID=2482724 RepID=A0A401U7A9_9BACT|nr:hypothetical protein [Chryseotalea sanaruensis]GCC50781.1 hypothetical protein SanaruYs_09990 [Chryseotalea sanaruensis]
MIAPVPEYVNYLFIFTTMLTLWFFYKASQSKLAVFILLGWIALQGIISDSGFYIITNTVPPHFVFLVLPPLVLIAYVLLSKPGQHFIDSLDTRWLTYLHVIRIPVEVTLYFLFVNKLLPELMTFEGNNFDILSGITAPIIAYFGYSAKKLSKGVLLGWNFLCLALLFNIVTTAVLSAPFPFQQFAFEQPNVGVLYFPFSWLPGFVVPMVLFSHVVSIRQLLKVKL